MARLSAKKRALFALVFVAVVLIGAEAVLRLHDFSFYFNFGADVLGMPLLDMHSKRRVMNRTVEFDPYLFWRFKPDQTLDHHGIYRKTVHINEHGFRGPSFKEQRPDRVFRVACIGDSTTFGWSVGDSEAFPAVLESMLTRDCGRGGVEVLNLGVTGYTSFQGMQLMKRCASDLDPQVVIFAFGPNDRLPAIKSDKEHMQDRTFDIGRMSMLLHRIQIYKLVKSGVVYADNLARGITLDPETYIPRIKRKVSMEEFQKNVETVKQECDKIGAGLVLVHVDYPSLPPDHVTSEIKKVAEEHGAKMPEKWKPWKGRELMRIIAGELELQAVDLRKLFKRKLERIQKRELDPERAGGIRKKMPGLIEKEPWRHLMIDNGHPNEWGHEIIAEELARMVSRFNSFKDYCGRDAGK